MAEQTRVDKIKEGMEGSRLEEVRSMLNRKTLLPLACKILKCAEIELHTWDCVQIAKGASGNQIYRIACQGTAENQPASCTLFLKILNKSTDTIGLNDTDWKREPLVYESGLVSDLPKGLRAVECYQLDYISETEIWMWLEDVSEPDNKPWPLARYGLLARHLGQLNGIYLVGRTLPTYAWLVRSFEQTAVHRDCNRDLFNITLDVLQENKLVPPKTAQSAIRLWEEKEVILANLYDHLPQTFSHFDSDRRNIFSHTQPEDLEESVAIDWGLAGLGAIGEELKRMVISNLLFRYVEINQANEFYTVAMDGYLNGLNDVGWKGNPDLARYGLAASTGLGFLRWLSLFGTVLPEPDADMREFQERAWSKFWNGRRCTFEDILSHVAQMTSFSFDLVDEARDYGRTLF